MRLPRRRLGAEGLGCEPASAVTLAGLKKLRADGKIRSNETVVLVLTGHTLKDADYTIDFHRGTLLTEEESAGREAEIGALQAQCRGGGRDDFRSAGRDERQSRMSEQEKPLAGGLRLRLPATSANLGPGFDAVAVALDFYLELDAESARASSRLLRRAEMRSGAGASKTI